MRHRSRLPVCLVLLGWLVSGSGTLGHADVRSCECDLTKQETAAARTCGLCRVTTEQPPDPPVYLLKDNDPTKPNRWLALPRAAYDGPYPLVRMTKRERADLWNLAIGKGRELWGNDWAIAMNSDYRRLQCHAHVHIGKLLAGAETDDGVFVDGPEQIPAHPDGMGLWFHPVGNRLHVHTGAEAPEFVLMR